MVSHSMSATITPWGLNVLFKHYARCLDDSAAYLGVLDPLNAMYDGVVSNHVVLQELATRRLPSEQTFHDHLRFACEWINNVVFE